MKVVYTWVGCQISRCTCNLVKSSHYYHGKKINSKKHKIPTVIRPSSLRICNQQICPHCQGHAKCEMWNVHVHAIAEINHTLNGKLDFELLMANRLNGKWDFELNGSSPWGRVVGHLWQLALIADIWEELSWQTSAVANNLDLDCKHINTGISVSIATIGSFRRGKHNQRTQPTYWHEKTRRGEMQQTKRLQRRLTLTQTGQTHCATNTTWRMTSTKRWKKSACLLYNYNWLTQITPWPGWNDTLFWIEIKLGLFTQWVHFARFAHFAHVGANPSTRCVCVCVCMCLCVCVCVCVCVCLRWFVTHIQLYLNHPKTEYILIKHNINCFGFG